LTDRCSQNLLMALIQIEQHKLTAGVMETGV
jgi:hypothetical protein